MSQPGHRSSTAMTFSPSNPMKIPWKYHCPVLITVWRLVRHLWWRRRWRCRLLGTKLGEISYEFHCNFVIAHMDFVFILPYFLCHDISYFSYRKHSENIWISAYLVHVPYIVHHKLCFAFGASEVTLSATAWPKSLEDSRSKNPHRACLQIGGICKLDDLDSECHQLT